MKTDTLVLILGDQLDRHSSALAACDKQHDLVVMIESREESTRVWSHKARTGLFLAAMRQHRDWLIDQGFEVAYIGIDQPEAESFDTALRSVVKKSGANRLVMTEAGEFGVEQQITSVCGELGVIVETRPDTHFICSRSEFADWAGSRKTMVMEHFYRHMRKTHDVLMVDGGPAGGEWNFDKLNRKPFGREGPGMLPRIPGFEPDDTTQGALDDVQRLFPDNPGSVSAFSWPVTREQALASLDDFIAQRLPAFGPFQDAMWTGEHTLHHSLLSAAMNLKLLNPREVIDAAVAAADEGHAPLQSVEGFVRQILGWREFVRGVYWKEMPDLVERNELEATGPLPDFYWTGETDMACLRHAIGQTLELGYAHHIQRLMVTGLFSLLLGVRPQAVHEWYLAVYVDAVEWVEAPNTIGMSQFADGGILGSKPYAASGRYIQRMSNYCSECQYAPDKATGTQACPFTTLYWDFLMRHEKRFARHPRAAMQWRSLNRLDKSERTAIKRAATQLRKRLTGESASGKA